MAQINFLSSIEFGAGAIATLGDAVRGLGMTRPMLISDRGLMATGLVDRVREQVPEICAVFVDVPTNPTEEAVTLAVAQYRSSQADGLIAVGGGSPIDLAKGVALLSSHPSPLSQYAVIEGGMARITAAVPPVIAVPTTAGTGAEVGRASLLTLNDGRKLGFISPHLIPKRVICDPELTLALPPGLTAATGMDALSHCFETFFSPRFNPPIDAVALDGAGRIWRSLEAAFHQGGDLAHRTEMMMGALEGGLCFQKGLGAVHSLSHALGAIKDLKLHHGTLNAILLAPIVRQNGPHIVEKAERLKQAIGLQPADDLAEAVLDLNRRIGMPSDLKSLGVTTEMIPGIVERALADHSHATNPVPLTAGEYESILEALV